METTKISHGDDQPATGPATAIAASDLGAQAPPLEALPPPLEALPRAFVSGIPTGDKTRSLEAPWPQPPRPALLALRPLRPMDQPFGLQGASGGAGLMPVGPPSARGPHGHQGGGAPTTPPQEGAAAAYPQAATAVAAAATTPIAGSLVAVAAPEPAPPTAALAGVMAATVPDTSDTRGPGAAPTPQAVLLRSARQFHAVTASDSADRRAVPGHMPSWDPVLPQQLGQHPMGPLGPGAAANSAGVDTILRGQGELQQQAFGGDAPLVYLHSPPQQLTDGVLPQLQPLWQPQQQQHYYRDEQQQQQQQQQQPQVPQNLVPQRYVMSSRQDSPASSASPKPNTNPGAGGAAAGPRFPAASGLIAGPNPADACVEVTVAVRVGASGGRHSRAVKVPVDGSRDGYVKGPVCGLFDVNRYLADRDCILYNGRWLSRSSFEKVGGSKMAKWYKSIRLTATLDSLGEWLEQQGLEVARGPSRRSSKRVQDSVDLQAPAQEPQQQQQQLQRGSSAEAEASSYGAGAPVATTSRQAAGAASGRGMAPLPGMGLSAGLGRESLAGLGALQEGTADAVGPQAVVSGFEPVPVPGHTHAPPSALPHLAATCDEKFMQRLLNTLSPVQSQGLPQTLTQAHLQPPRLQQQQWLMQNQPEPPLPFRHPYIAPNKQDEGEGPPRGDSDSLGGQYAGTDNQPTIYRQPAVPMGDAPGPPAVAPLPSRRRLLQPLPTGGLDARSAGLAAGPVVSPRTPATQLAAPGPDSPATHRVASDAQCALAGPDSGPPPAKSPTYSAHMWPAGPLAGLFVPPAADTNATDVDLQAHGFRAETGPTWPATDRPAVGLPGGDGQQLPGPRLQPLRPPQPRVRLERLPQQDPWRVSQECAQQSDEPPWQDSQRVFWHEQQQQIEQQLQSGPAPPAWHHPAPASEPQLHNTPYRVQALPAPLAMLYVQGGFAGDLGSHNAAGFASGRPGSPGGNRAPSGSRPGADAASGADQDAAGIIDMLVPGGASRRRPRPPDLEEDGAARHATQRWPQEEQWEQQSMPGRLGDRQGPSLLLSGRPRSGERPVQGAWLYRPDQRDRPQQREAQQQGEEPGQQPRVEQGQQQFVGQQQQRGALQAPSHPQPQFIKQEQQQQQELPEQQHSLHPGVQVFWGLSEDTDLGTNIGVGHTGRVVRQRVLTPGVAADNPDDQASGASTRRPGGESPSGPSHG